MISKRALVAALEKGIVRLQFLKADGKPREMRCTLNDKYLPDRPAPARKRKDEDLVVVWDLEKRGWRSFRYSSLETLIEYPT